MSSIKCNVFTTGAFLYPALVDGEWKWVVNGFEDDTFMDGEIVDLRASATTEDGLIIKEEEND